MFEVVIPKLFLNLECLPAAPIRDVLLWFDALAKNYQPKSDELFIKGLKGNDDPLLEILAITPDPLATIHNKKRLIGMEILKLKSDILSKKPEAFIRAEQVVDQLLINELSEPLYLEYSVEFEQCQHAIEMLTVASSYVEAALPPIVTKMTKLTEILLSHHQKIQKLVTIKKGLAIEQKKALTPVS